ncbi:CARDB domain-containing protein [Mariniflexile sp. AS56]|uniref:CARDB domain-containing protein n=1 Tax=Mariniflexile sp. AS56 TaxID=3063957 RepID=UPI0026EE5533|nr:CARDB domain-containing protein [Mariniflexile sp. AS56]MDO7170808.1 CARDB domain-containing protein [Mariniflexile sp. AS56]
MRALLTQLRLPPIKYKFWIILLTIWASSNTITAQSITQLEYFFGTDPGFGNGTTVNVTLNTGELLQEALSIPTTGLNSGFHSLQIRALDDQGTWGLYNKSAFYVVDDISAPGSDAAYPLARAEYWFDTDPGFGNGTDIVISGSPDSVQQSYAIPIGSLAGGFHSLGIRVQNENGVWSLYRKSTFYVVDDISVPGGDDAFPLAGAEYWFDADPGQGGGTALTISDSPNSTTQSYLIPLDDLTGGFHSLGIRVQNENGVWSLYRRSTFYVVDDISAPGSGPIANLTRVEYWFDNDPGTGSGTKVSLSGNPSTTTESFLIPLGALGTGFHKLGMRIENENGTWSLYDRRTFYIFENVNQGGDVSPLADAEVLFNANLGYGTGNAVPITPTGNPNEYVVEIPGDLALCGISSLSISVKNEDGTYSLYETITDIEVEDTDGPTIRVFEDVTVELGENGEGFITIDDVNNGSFDNCELASVALDEPQIDFTCADLGANTVTVTATDTNGSETTLGVTITVVDSVAPVAQTQNITAELQSNGSVSITADQIDNGSTDNCAIANFSLDITAFTCENIGENIVTLTVEDTSGNQHAATATVNVVDNLAPNANARNISVTLDETGNASITVDDIDISSDNCGITQKSIDIDTFTCDDIGLNTVTLTVEDAQGQSDTDTAIVTVIAPEITTNDITIELDANGEASITPADINGVLSENCGFSSVSLSKSTFNCNDLGGNTVSLLVTYTNGNTGSSPATVTVEDNMNPVAITKNISVSLDASGNASITANDVDDNSTDNCSITSRSIDIDSFTCANLGANTVTLTVEDASGNSDSATAIVTIEDNTNPNVLTQPVTIVLDATGNASISVNDVDNGSTDNCGITSRSLSQTNFSCNNLGTNSVSLFVTDQSNNTVNGIAIITVLEGAANCSSTLDSDGDGVIDTLDCAPNDATISATITYYVDNDGDGFGTTPEDICSNTAPTGYATVDGDCNDTDATVNPGATEVAYDGIDNDCDPATLDDDLDEDGFVLANDCDDTDASISNTVTYYVDADGDGFGSTLENICSNITPDGYATVGGDCDDTDNTVNPNAIEIAGNGKDDDCNPDTPDSASDIDDDGDGFTENQGDCDDTDADINPIAQFFAFSGNPGFVATIIDPLVGAPIDDYNLEVIFTDTRNIIPQFGYPRVIFDYDADGVFNTANDKTIVLTEGNATDTNIADGKLYVGTISPLEANTEYEIFTEVVIDGCSTIFGPFDAPDVLTQSDIEIFANDIVFDNPNPEPSSLLQITATIHNASDLPAENFFVGLLNEWDPTIPYPDLLVPYIAPNSSEQVVWNITTPDEIGWMPMRVSIDVTNVINESNELDNNAVRPFTNGDYNVPGTIVVDVNVTPSIVNINYPSVRVSGYAYYDDTAVELEDPSVAGATVDIFIEDLNRTIQVHTNSNGIFSTSFSASNNVGTYTVTAEVTDYTLTGAGSDTFEIVYNPISDWGISVAYDDNSILEGGTTSGKITVYNNGDQTLPATTVDFAQFGGVPILPNSYAVPGLMEDESHIIDLDVMTFATAGTYNIRGTVITPNTVTEAYTSNNTSIDYLQVLVGLPDLIPWSGPRSSSFFCNSNLTPTFSVRNAGNVPAGSFDVEVDIYEGSTFIGTETHTISGLNNGQSASFSLAYTYPSEGSYNFDVRVDVPIASNGVVSELRENNNIASYSRTLSECKPDLTVSGCGGDMVVEPIDPGNVATNTYRTTVTNSGNATAIAPFDVQFQVVGGAFSTVTVSDNIEPGGSVSVEVEMPFAGINEELIVTADTGGIINELNETNNSNSSQLCHEFYLTPPCGASGGQFWGKNEFIQFSTVVPWIKLHNQYLYAASEVDVKFEVQTPSSGGFIELSQESEENILGCHAGCSLSRSYVMNNSFVFAETGNYTFRWTADPDGAYQECDDTNNVYIRTINVKNLPDMRVLSQFINPDILNPAVGEAVSFDITYENIAFPNTGEEMDFDIYVDEVFLERIENVPGLLSNTNSTVSVSTPWLSTTAGAHIVRIIIDSKGEIIETNELNNEATRAIIVGEAANLFFKEFGVDNESPLISQVLQINGVIENNGDINVDAEVEFYYVDNNGQEQYLGKQDISVVAGGEVPVSYNWDVSDTETTIIGRIVNPSVIEFDENDNEASADISSGLSVSFVTTEACELTEELGSATANATGSSGNYSYEWNTGETTQTINKPAGTYIVTVTDIGTDEMIEISVTITQGEDCIDYCPDDDDKIYPGLCGCGTPDTDTDGDGIADCDDAEVNSPCPDDVDENGVSINDCSPNATDDDDDGFSENEGDCDDTNPNISPNATEVPYDGIDNDCNPSTLDDDLDEDGFVLANDCNDNDDSVDATTTYYVDSDGDGYGTTAEAICSATVPNGYAEVSGDCDDTNAQINPGATEVSYDGVDNDCNPETRDDDLDADGFDLANDCNDADGTVNTVTIYYVDTDGDGYGRTAEAICSATVPNGYAEVAGDCDDTNAGVNPGATEVVDGIDNNCDGIIDEGVIGNPVWTGYLGTDWSVEGNWEGGFSPGLSINSDVKISGGLSNYPILETGQNLSVSEGGSLTIESGASLIVSPSVVITNNGVITVVGSLTMQSDTSGSAYIGESTGVFVGDVTVERYIPARRAFRQLSSPVTTSDFISNNWQQGTHITGSIAGANGFDATGTGNPSMYMFDNNSYSYVSMPNTDGTNLVTGQGYHILVRGDRTIDLTNNSPEPSETVLRATGVLVGENAGTSTIEVDVPVQRFVFFGNPFQAPVDMSEILFQNTINIAPVFYWVWDPNIGNRGAYATVYAALGTATAGNANQFLQPGQAGWVYTGGAGLASLDFTQASKNTSMLETDVFKTVAKKASTGQLRLKLFETSALAASQSEADGVLVLFDNAGNNGIDENDAPKLTNLDENFATSNDGVLLGVESRATPEILEQIPLEINTYRYSDYTIVAEGIELQGAIPYLLDTYTNVSTVVPQNGVVNYSYTIDESVPESIAGDRFVIGFSSQTLTSLKWSVQDIVLYPNPTAEGRFFLDIPKNMNDLEVTIYNTLGAKLFYETGFKASQHIAIKTNFTREQGVYFVNLTSNGVTTIKRIIIN